MEISSGELTLNLPWVGSKLMASTGMEAAEPTGPLTRCFQKGLQVSHLQLGPLFPAGVGQLSMRASGSWAGATASSPCRGGDSSPDSVPPAKARAGAGAGEWMFLLRVRTSVPVAGGPGRHRSPNLLGCCQYPDGPGVFGRGNLRSLSPPQGSLGPTWRTTSVGIGLRSGLVEFEVQS